MSSAIVTASGPLFFPRVKPHPASAQVPIIYRRQETHDHYSLLLEAAQVNL
jgi:hypothetical protein